MTTKPLSFYDICKRTKLEYNERLSNIYNCNIYLKREDLQVVRSFKIRGAFNKISKLEIDQKKNGIVCVSAGNHAQGVANTSYKLKINCEIYDQSQLLYKK